MRWISRLLAFAAIAVVGLLAALLIDHSVHGPVTTVTTVATTTKVKTLLTTTTVTQQVAIAPAASPDKALVVISPRRGESVATGFTVAGEADVAGGKVVVHLYGADGGELVRNVETSSCGGGCRGTFVSTVYYSVPKAEQGTLVVEDSGVTPVHQVKVAVSLQP